MTPPSRWGERQGREDGVSALCSLSAPEREWVVSDLTATLTISSYFTLGKLNSAPPLMPAGQRVVTVLSRV